ncbi:response regulator [Leifsonia shinshuensis]|uniref:response regulator n=1 Tax=Leifsonia shinshuensis TaxID=150026 RepID=UPI0028630C7F|nr:response regulator [Leifsonia shinshuensis]MDR6972706.1 response regulator of citrate/malate metabolism [Leifsonia shinshuensis]
MTDDIQVLIVEDEAITADAHAAYVERLDGFSVSAIARTGGAAIRVLRAAREAGRRIDLLLLDVHLPDMTGIDLCRSMRAAGVETDVIAITAARDAATVRSAVALGVVQYLIKPFTFAAFAEKLRAYKAYRESVPVRYADQGTVDAAFAQLRSNAGNVALPKGLSSQTLSLVRRVLRESDGGLSAVQVAQRAELSRPTARRYLDHLADIGDATRCNRYGTPGRPEIEYQLNGIHDHAGRTSGEDVSGL